MTFPALTTPARIAVTIGVILLGIVVLSVTMIVPSFQGIRMLASSIEVEHARIEPLLSRGLAYRETVKEIEQMKKNIPAMRALFLHKGEEAALFAKLKETSSGYGLTETVRVGDGLSSGELTILPIDLELHGTYLHVLEYLHYLESSPVLIAIKTLDIRSTPGETSPFTAKITASVYIK